MPVLCISDESFFCSRYIQPYWSVLAANVTSALYVYLFLRETVQAQPSAKLLSSSHYKAVWRLLSTQGGVQLWLYLLCFFIEVAVHKGCAALYVLYELSSPLCWGPTLIGFGSAALHTTYLSSLLGLKLMQRCLVDSWVALIGLLSNITGLLVLSVANTTQLMFTGDVWREEIESHWYRCRPHSRSFRGFRPSYKLVLRKFFF